MNLRTAVLGGLTAGALLLCIAPAEARSISGSADVPNPSTASATIYGDGVLPVRTVPIPARKAASGEQWNCYYHAFPESMGGNSSLDLVPPMAEPATHLVDGETYAFKCTRADGSLVQWPTPEDPVAAMTASSSYKRVRYNPLAPAAPLNDLPVFRLQELAKTTLTITPITVKISPEGTQLIGLPTWFWLDGEYRTREATSAEAVDGVRVRVTATVRAVDALEIETGDGPTIHCPADALAWVSGAGYADTEPGSCRHTYQHLAKDGHYTAKVRVRYDAEWETTDGSLGGVLDGGLVSQDFELAITTKATQAVGR